MKKSTQIFFGILTGLAVWLSGIFLSGRFAFVEETVLYPAGYLVFLFPLLFSAVCILISKNASKNGTKPFFTAFLASAAYPLVSSAICFPVNSMAESANVVLSHIGEALALIFTVSTISPVSLLTQIADAVDSGSADSASVAAIAVIICVAVMLTGYIASIIIYKKRSRSAGAKEPNTNNE